MAKSIKHNIALIGMAGSGKSVVGKKLAYKLRYIFFDLDDRLEVAHGERLTQLIKKIDEQKFLQLEERFLLDFLATNPYHAVIAPGGSIVFSKLAIQKLKKQSFVIFINTPFSIIKTRTDNEETRGGVIGLKEMGSLQAVYQFRLPLYQQYADVIIDVGDFSEEKVVEKIIAVLPIVSKKKMVQDRGVDFF